MKNGDIFFWRYKEGNGVQGAIYWCKSQIAIFNGDRLVDTYSDYEGGFSLNLDKVEIEYQGNQFEMKEVQANEAKYYTNDDVVDTRHSNSYHKTVYLKARTKRNGAKMLERIKDKIANNDAKIDYAKRENERLNEEINKINNGLLMEVYF